MPRPRRPLACLAAAGVVAVIAGCGGGGSDGLSADEFREQADAVCADANARLDALTEPASGAEVLPFLQSGLPIQAEQLDRIRELEPPEDLQPAVDEATELLQQRQDAIQDAADRIAAGEDPEAVIAEIDPEVDRLRDEARAKAQELGLTVCGSGDDDPGTATAGTVATAPDTPTGTTAGATGATAQYNADVRAALASLSSVSEQLQAATSLGDLQARVPGARSELGEFDATIATIAGYQFDDATLEAQRARVVAAGPDVSAALRDFLAAAAAGDPESVQSLLPEIVEANAEFVAAANIPG